MDDQLRPLTGAELSLVAGGLVTLPIVFFPVSPPIRRPEPPVNVNPGGPIVVQSCVVGPGHPGCM
jgi:hypothetical protein